MRSVLDSGERFLTNVVLAIGVCALALSSWLLWDAKRTLELRDRIAKWTEAAGVITGAHVTGGWRRISGAYFVPHVEYEFRVSGSVIRGNVISFSDAGEYRIRLEAERHLKPIGSDVVVFFDPERPVLNSLSREVPGAADAQTVELMGIVAGVFGVVLVLLSVAVRIKGT
jgi:hypothetical protein